MMIAALLLLAASPTPVTAARAPAPVETREPTPAELDESLTAVRSADIRQMIGDRDYAAQILLHLDRLAPRASNADAAIAIDNMRLTALTTLERRDEAAALVDRMLTSAPSEPRLYLASLRTTLIFRDSARTIALVETASRSVPGLKWAELRGLLDREWIFPLLGRLRTAHDEASRVRLAEALFRIGWPGDGMTGSGDSIRKILLDARLAAGDPAGAAGLAAGISSPGHLLPLLVGKRYDRLFPADVDRLALLARAIEGRDRETAAALASAPGDFRRQLARAQYLRSVGRDADALPVLASATRDIAAAAVEEDGMWAVNEAAYALSGIGRDDEAVRLMEAIAALPLERHPHLASARINHLEILSAAGRDAEALDRATPLDAPGSRVASDYGKAWIDSTRVCALASLGRNAETAAPLARLRGWSEINAPALTRALLCLNDLDVAAALLVRRLGSDEPEGAILALQDYSLSHARGQTSLLHGRLMALRDRPDVRAALDRVGRVLRLPLARDYWGDF